MQGMDIDELSSKRLDPALFRAEARRFDPEQLPAEVMYLYLWPVENASQAPLPAAVECVEIEGEDGYWLGLNSCGMDLSAALCQAYLACGYVPPRPLLSGVGVEMLRKSEQAKWAGVFAACLDRWAEYASSVSMIATDQARELRSCFDTGCIDTESMVEG